MAEVETGEVAASTSLTKAVASRFSGDQGTPARGSASGPASRSGSNTSDLGDLPRSNSTGGMLDTPRRGSKSQPRYPRQTNPHQVVFSISSAGHLCVQVEPSGGNSEQGDDQKMTQSLRNEKLRSRRRDFCEIPSWISSIYVLV